MQQRQLRLGDILDDYCPRERRVTNHVIVAMIGDDVKQVRCSTCDADHEFKHAKVPRQRRKTETPAALYAQVLATGPKRVTHENASAAEPAPDAVDASDEEPIDSPPTAPREDAEAAVRHAAEDNDDQEDSGASDESDQDEERRDEEDGPIHRRLIRASLPKIDGAPPPARQMPEFTIRQPAGRPANRFRPRGPRGGPGGGGGGQQFQGNRSGGGNAPGGPRGNGGMRSNGGGGRPQGPGQGQGHGGGQMRRNGPGGRRRSK
jgi:translation initiation factor IF-2